MIASPPETLAGASTGGAALEFDRSELLEAVRGLVDSSSEANRDTLMGIAEVIAKSLRAPSLRIWTVTPDRRHLDLSASVGLELPFEALQDYVPVEQTELGSVYTGGKPLITQIDGPDVPRDVRSWAERRGVKSFFSFPLRDTTNCWGVLGGFTSQRLTSPQSNTLSEIATLIGDTFGPSDGSGDPSKAADLLSSLIPCLSSAIITVDAENKVTHWDSRAEELLGWSQADILGKVLPLPKANGSAGTCGSDPAGDDMRIFRTRTVCEKSDLSPIPIQRTTGPLVARDGQLLGRIEVLSDDSQQVRMSRCLRVQGEVARILAGSRQRDEGLALLLAELGKWQKCESVELWIADDSKHQLTRSAVWGSSAATIERLSATHLQVKTESTDRPARYHRENRIVFESGPAETLCSRSGQIRTVSGPPHHWLGLPIHRDGVRLGVMLFSGGEMEAPDELGQQTLRFSADALAQFLLRFKAEAALAETESNLRQSQKMDAIGLLAGGVAHDFNNLLTIILAYSELGLDEIEEQHPLHELFTEIRGAGDRAARMTQQLLAVSRQQPARSVVCNLNELIQEMDRMFRRLLGPEITLQHELDDDLANVHVDINQIEQVLLNLVVNARDAMRGGGTITVATRNTTRKSADSKRADSRVRPFVELLVSDTGCGMDEATRARIFEPFFTTKNVGEGTGMGLSTVFGIVKQSGGIIEVESEPNVGTTFSIAFPQARQALTTQRIDDQPHASPTGTESVLVVESDEAVRKLIRRLLEVRGYSVIEAGDGAEALKLITRRKPAIDLILADMQFRIVDGVTLSALLKARKSSQRALLMSGNTSLTRDQGAGIFETLLQKPFTSGELANMVRRALDSP